MPETRTEKFVLKKGGELIRVRGLWDEDKEEWSYLEEIVEYPPNAYEIHDVKFELEKGVLFKDVFIYRNKDLEYWNLILGNWCEENVASALNTPKSSEEDTGDDIKSGNAETFSV